MTVRITLPTAPRPTGRSVLHGIEFRNGEAVVDRKLSADVLMLLERRGATVEAVAEPESSDEEPKAFADMTIAELRAYAAAHEVDLPSSAAKAELVDILTRHGLESLDADPELDGRPLDTGSEED